MAALFKKALDSCVSQGEVQYLRPNKVSSVYDCCTFYWLPIDKRMWSGELDFKFIENWAEDVELDLTGDEDKNNNNKPATRPTSRPTISSVYDCCTFYWLPIDKRMWSGELDFKFIENWAEDVELDLTGDEDKNNNNKPATRPTSRPTISSVYDCCTFYWLPIDKRMWSGELDFKFIENWAEDVELDLTGDEDKNNNNKPATRPTSRPTSSTWFCGKMQAENWDSELLKCEMSSSWEEELFSDLYLKSFYNGNNKFFNESWEGDLFTENYIRSFENSSLSFKESWEGDLFTENYIRSFEDSCLSFKESWEEELLF